MASRFVRCFVVLAIGVLFAFGVGPSSTVAATRQPPAVFGPGFGSCGQWTAAHQGYSAITSGQDAWLLGYLSAYSYWGTNRTKDLFDKTGNGALIGWVSDYCAAHPQDQIATAARALVADLNRRAGHER